MVSKREKNTHGLADGYFRSEKSNRIYNKTNLRLSVPDAKGDAPEAVGQGCTIPERRQLVENRLTAKDTLSFNELPQKILVSL